VRGGAWQLTSEHLPVHSLVLLQPCTKACAHLGMGLTIFKRLCRKHGLYQWPYRALKKQVLCKVRYNLPDTEICPNPNCAIVSNTNVSNTLHNVHAKWYLCLTQYRHLSLYRLLCRASWSRQPCCASWQHAGSPP
jgi:hypothetical protein